MLQQTKFITIKDALLRQISKYKPSQLTLNPSYALACCMLRGGEKILPPGWILKQGLDGEV